MTEPNFREKIWFLGKRGKSAEKWLKMWFFGFFSKTSHEIFLKLAMNLEVYSRNNFTQPDFLQKILFWGKRGKSDEKWRKMWFFGFFSKTSHEIFLKLGMHLEVYSRNNFL